MQDFWTLRFLILIFYVVFWVFKVKFSKFDCKVPSYYGQPLDYLVKFNTFYGQSLNYCSSFLRPTHELFMQILDFLHPIPKFLSKIPCFYGQPLFFSNTQQISILTPKNHQNLVPKNCTHAISPDPISFFSTLLTQNVNKNKVDSLRRERVCNEYGAATNRTNNE